MIEKRRRAANGPAAERCTCHGGNATSVTNGIDDARNLVTRLQVSRGVDRALQFRRKNLRIPGVDEKIDRKIGERRRYSISIARDVTTVAYTKPTTEIANVVTDKLQPTIIKILRQTAVTRAHPYARTRVRTRVVAVRSLVTCRNSDSDAISICRSDAIKRTDYSRPSARSSAAFHRFTIAITFPSRYSSRLSPRANVRATQQSLSGYGQTIIISGR